MLTLGVCGQGEVWDPFSDLFVFLLVMFDPTYNQFLGPSCRVTHSL